jgi:hypothetical protein
MVRFFAVFVATIIVASCGADNKAQLGGNANASMPVSNQSVFQSKNYGSFKGFEEKDINQPDGYAFIQNPTESSLFKKVHSFSIEPGCKSNVTYHDGNASDCKYGSVRAELSEDGRNWPDLQPDQAWYGWDIYIPKDFPTARQQGSGKYLLGQWHNGQCPHISFINQPSNDNLYLQTMTALGNYECRNRSKTKIVSFSELKGKWTRFETFVKWSSNEDGEVKIYVDGQLKVDRKGPNLTVGFENNNHFDFGVYLCCTNNINRIKRTTVLYANVSRASQRERLR